MGISKDELLKGRDKQFPSEYTQEVSGNLDKLLIPLNKIRDAYGKPMSVSSGWRPAAVNGSAGGASKSKHLVGLACDIVDSDGAVMKWVLQNLQMMKDLGIYMEDFRWTPNWVHFQLGGPGSGKRIYVPNSNPASAPSKWDGKYDSQFDT